MALTISVSENKDYILAVLTGAINRQAALRMHSEMFARGDQEMISRYLVDLRRARNDESVLDQYTFAYQDMRLNEKDLKRSRVAIVVADDDRSHDFIMTVTKNAGLNITFFTQITEAEAYLAE